MGRKKKITSETLEDAEYGPQLQTLRKEAGVTQKELADHLGYSEREVRHWEHGKTHCPCKKEIFDFLEPLKRERAASASLNSFTLPPCFETDPDENKDGTISQWLRDHVGLEPSEYDHWIHDPSLFWPSD